MGETTINIEGMSCQHCVMRVRKALEALHGVSNITVEVGVAKASFDETKIQKKDLEDAIVKAGYRIKAG